MSILSRISVSAILLLLLGGSNGQYNSNSYGGGLSSQYNGGNQMQVNNNNADVMSMFMSNPNVTSCITEQQGLMQMIVATDPSVFFKVMYNYCDAEKEVQFKEALKDYETCSGTDMNKFIETLAGASIGTFMHCSQYFTDLGKELERAEMRGMGPSFPLLRIPDQCVEAFVGDNPFGNMVRFYQEYPEEDIQCFYNLYKAMPDCTLNEWPIPLIGAIFKPIACVYGNALPILEQSCRNELSALNSCLNTVSEITPGTCNSVIQECTKNINNYPLDPSTLPWHMMLPPPLLGMPISDICRRMAKEDSEKGNIFGYQSAVDKYSEFRTNCVSAADLGIWDVEATKALPAGDTVFTAAKKASPTPTVKAQKKSGGFGTFVFGMIIGAALLVAGLIGYGRNYTHRGGVQIGHVRFGTPYNMLEMTDNNEISFT